MRLEHNLDIPLLVTEREEMNVQEFFDHAAGLARELAFAGQPVLLQMENSPEFLLALFALLKSRARVYLGSTFWSEAQRMEIVERYRIRHVISGLPLYFPLPGSACEIPAGELRIFTSGSTSAPKACVLSTENLWLNAAGSNANLPFARGDRWSASLPFFHVGGVSLVFRALHGGGAVCFSENLAEVTHVSWVPTQLHRLIASGTNDLPSAILLGGGAPSRALLEEVRVRALPVFRTYGMSEMGSQITTTDTPDDLESSGRTLRHRELTIQKGRVLVRGPVLFRGYELSADAFDAPFDEDGWFATGDLGEVRDGRLFVVGREGRAFKSGGEFIHPEAIEAILLGEPQVIQARVVGIPDAEYGASVVAYVHSAIELDVDFLRSRIREKLSGLHVPKRILPWTDLGHEGSRKGTKDWL